MDNLTVAEQAARWLLKNREGFTRQERQAFEHWLSTPEHADEFQQMQAVWQEASAIPSADIARLRPAGMKKNLSFWRTGACVGALLLMAVVLWSPLRDQFASPLYSASWQTARGEQREITLPDGSVVNLDAQTTLRVNYFAHRREVVLERGQAFFSVMHLSERPFVVLSGPSRATVIGTAFQVRYLPHSMSGNGVDVAVSKGAVRVGPRNRWENDWWRTLQHLNLNAAARHLTVLHAAQRTRSNADGELITPVTTNDIAAWKEDRIVFDNTRLDMALAEFARYGDVPLRIDADEVASLRVSGSFEVNRVASFAKALPAVLPVKIKNQNNQMVISPRASGQKKE
jgi:transmembrane sensor